MKEQFYDLHARTPRGEDVPMSSYKGKVLLVVNTATECGLAPQFEGLENLYLKYRDKGLMVLGFPSNQFGHQEPVDNAQMESTCRVNFGVTFPLFEKSDVNGKDTNPVFRYLKRRLWGILGGRIAWNFTKFLVDAEGHPVKRFSPVTKPESVEPYIESLLAKTPAS